MITRFSLLDLSLWSAVTLLQFVLAVIVCSRGIYKKYPYFSAFIAISTTNHLLLMLMAAVARERGYIAVLFVGSAVADVSVVLLMGELWRRILGPRFTLPRWVLRNFVRSLVAVSAVVWPVAFLVDLALVPHPFRGFLETFSTLDEITVGVILTVLSCMLLYARSLHLKARKAECGIAGGFIVCLLAFLVTDAIRSHGSTEAAMVAQRACQLVYCATLAIWMRSVLYREPVGSLATMEEVRRQSEKLLPIEKELGLGA